MQGLLRSIGPLVLIAATSGCPSGQGGDTEGEATTATTGAATDATPTTGVGITATLCEAACAHLRECGATELAPSEAECVAQCEASASRETPSCEVAAHDLYACLRDAPCGEIQPLESGRCKLADADYVITCLGCPTALKFAGVGQCAANVACADAFAVAFACDSGQCTCALDGEEYTVCAEADACAEGTTAIFAAATRCCGVPFTP